MRQANISLTVQQGLCSGCGICAGVCPKNCIGWVMSKGMYQPSVNAAACISCGLCRQVCPGLGHVYALADGKKAVEGQILATYNAWSSCPQTRHVSASGGVITTIVRHLLEQGVYDLAFSVDTYDYRDRLLTAPVRAEDLSAKESSCPKSRYLPVSHEKAVAYIKAHREERVILIGTGCAIRGLRAVIETLHLHEENYLLLGLFCDRVFTYHVMEYYQQDRFCGGKMLTKLHFKNKESGGWPGNMKFMFADGSSAYFDKSERAKMKDYFMPERCLYCVDKLNACADISVGDNYTGENDSELGSNSVIVRTETGRKAWESACGLLEYVPTQIEKIHRAQSVGWRLNHFYFGKLKEKKVQKETGEQLNLNAGITAERDPVEYQGRMRRNLAMLHLGENYHAAPQETEKKIEKMEQMRDQLSAKDYAWKIYDRVCRIVSKGKRS